MSASDSPQSDVALTDVMLAMDVVDTLRHEEQMVEQALNAEAREQELIRRVRRAYASQGIDVTDAMIEQGVAALKAKQFHYAAPPAGLRTRIATAWVNRARIGTGFSFFAGLAAMIGLAWYGFVEWPAASERREQAQALNQSVVVARTDVDLARQRMARLQRTFAAVDDSTISDNTRRAFDNTSSNVTRALASAEQSLRDAVITNSLPSLDADNIDTRAGEVQGALARQRDALSKVGTALDAAEQGIETLGQLGTLQATLQLLRDEGLELASEAMVDARINADYRAANAALTAGDSATAQRGAQAMRDMIETLRQQFSVRIVSRPGEASAVVREPPGNRRASNYYLIVEARDDQGQPVAVDITSEEDSTHRMVSRWAIRVDESVYERVRRDKMDDGIIQRAAAGQKLRGKLNIDYSLETTGRAIHTWEDFR
ncbi:MAG: DUF6384 family protein [Pseudomonadota bacterium]